MDHQSSKGLRASLKRASSPSSSLKTKFAQIDRQTHVALRTVRSLRRPVDAAGIKFRKLSHQQKRWLRSPITSSWPSRSCSLNCITRKARRRIGRTCIWSVTRSSWKRRTCSRVPMWRNRIGAKEWSNLRKNCGISSRKPLRISQIV